MDKILDFLKQGNNLYYVIGAAVLLVLIIIFAAVLTKRKKKSDDEEVTTEQPVNDAEYQDLSFEDPNLDGIVDERIAVEEEERKNNLIKTVEVTPVEKKVKPEPVNTIKKQPEPLKYVKKEVEDDEVANKRSGTIQIYKDNGDKFRFRFWAANSIMVGHSRGYETKALCRKAINDIKKIADLAVVSDTTKNEEQNVPTGTPIFEIYRDSENKFRFRLVTGIRVTKYLLASQGYTSKENCIKGIASVRFIASNHKIKDSTKEVKSNNG